jgi:hypothetical protein
MKKRPQDLDLTHPKAECDNNLNYQPYSARYIAHYIVLYFGYKEAPPVLPSGAFCD